MDQKSASDEAYSRMALTSLQEAERHLHAAAFQTRIAIESAQAGEAPSVMMAADGARFCCDDAVAALRIAGNLILNLSRPVGVLG